MRSSRLPVISSTWLLLVQSLFTTYSQAMDSDMLPSSFKDYTPYVLDGGSDKGKLYLAPELSKQTLKIKLKNEDADTGVQITTPKNNKLVIFFDTGPSDDPSFGIRINGKKALSYIGGDILFVSAGETFYSKSNSNEYYEKTSKYKIIQNKLVEVRQPFYLIDKTCKTSTVLNMYTQKCNKGEKVATLPADSNVRILLADFGDSACPKVKINDNEVGDRVMGFLVTTPFGLTGWVSSTGGYLTRPGKPLSCIRYFGD